MSNSLNEYPIPPKDEKSKIETASFLPRFYRTDSNKKFVHATVDQLVQPGTVKKVNGYIGRRNAKSSTASNIFVEAIDKLRQNYQLEPGLVVKDTLNNVEFYKDYIDYINQLGVLGAQTNNHERLNRQEFYSWNPHIDWDKFVNFQQYYWLPYGPDVIDVYGQQKNIDSTYTVVWESEGNSKQYLFTPNGLTRNPILKLYRGQTYQFVIDSPGEPFSFKITKTAGNLDRYNWGVDTVSAVEKGTITFKVPDSAPNVIFYVSENDANLGGVIKIYDIKENTEINVENDLLGKKTYTLPNGISLSNGMKLRFRGNVTPEKYANDLYYVEGVGSKISLVAERDLEIISTYTDNITVPFDDTQFDYYPFDIASSYSNKKDYIVINRASKDRNPWSRYNRWFHKDVVETSATINGKIASLDQKARAVRPIIEFEAGLKLYNFGLEALVDVDLIDSFTTDAFSIIEGSAGYSIDGIQLVNGHRILFTADTDILVKNKIYTVEFVTLNGERKLHLVETSSPVTYQTALIKYGRNNQGLMYWFNGTTWVKGQTKTAVNQPPLFDLVDINRYSYSNTTVYDGTTFVGTKLFSYAIGTGSNDSELGFPLKHKNINNVGDIVFNFNLLTDTFIYKTLTSVQTVQAHVGSLIKADGINNISYVNGWEISNVERYQPVVRIYKDPVTVTAADGTTTSVKQVNNFELDVYDNINDLDDLEVRVYVNGKRLDKSLWSLASNSIYKIVVLNSNILETDVLTIRSFARQPKNNNGYYEIPINLQNNPLNKDINDFTLGEVIDHVDSIIDNLKLFNGTYPGTSNLRDLGNVTPYGTKFVQHSGAIPLSAYHITSKNSNVIKALEEARDEYGKFKREFILVADELAVDIDPVAFVDLILEEVNKDKPKTAPYYFSDMVPYGAATVSEITVVDYRTQTYPLASNFTLNNLSPQAVLIYVNGTQLVYGKDYTFDGTGFVVITYDNLANGDTIKIVEYENTDGCYIPPTPTKLGLWPKYEPKIYLDTTLVTPRWMIQGHDGSQILAYGTYGDNGESDFRDAILLELEKRIFNNIKVDYDKNIFDIDNYLPRYNVLGNYSLTEFNEILAPNFYKWTTLVNNDFTKNIGFDRLNSLTYNYKDYISFDGKDVPGYWRGIYRWMFGTDRPNLCPWEMIGFSLEPKWWKDVYGSAPYTYDNFVMWQDIAEGIVREPGKPIIRIAKYARPYLMDHIPVTQDGLVRAPYETGIVSGLLNGSISEDFIFGDVSPVESAWRRSSYYPFSVIGTLILMYPAELIGKLYDRSRIYRDLSGQIVYKDTGVRTKLVDLVTPNIYTDNVRVQTAGLVNYLIDYIQSDNLKSLTQYRYDLDNLNVQLAYRVAGYTEKEKFNLILDSKNPTAVGGVFIPQENYQIFLNTSSPAKKLNYSGVLITRLANGYEVKGYNLNSPYFYYYPWIQQGYLVNIGGISETYSIWTSGQQYIAGKIVKVNDAYYRVSVTHTASATFEAAYYKKLPSLPVSGGREAFIRTRWDRNEKITVPYGTVFRTVQEVVDFLLGYGEYLIDQGFIFDDFNNNLGVITNWVTAAKEYLFWTTQNWSSGEPKWTDWTPQQDYEANTVVTYYGDYYRVLTNINSGTYFDARYYYKLDGLSTVGTSVISLSPAATNLVANLGLYVIEDIRDQFNGYEFFRPDGLKLEPEFLNSYRKENTIQYSPKDIYGIYGASFYLVQKEHVLLLDNTTLFNDTIYEQTTGYRQEKIKISAYMSTDWYGGFDIPGFIYDEAKVTNWQPWTDYNLGEVVKYKEFYYSASSFLPGTESFVPNSWYKLKEKPVSQMLPNWTYKAEQFNDFYSLDSDNFDVGQQKMAQHLIGYQKRQYLENIIKDDVSEYKFYQGMIIEKGTQNVLNKLFDVLSAENQESLKFFEEWAVRVGQYGSSKAFEEIEFTLDESLFKLNPQPIELLNQPNPEAVDFVIRQTPNDVYIKPRGYANAPWPTKSTYIPFLRTPGYVRMDDVAVNLDVLSDIISKDITGYNEGDYVWCAFEGRGWNVYRITDPSWYNGWSVDTLTYNTSSKKLTVTTTSNHGLTAGDIVGFPKADGAQGFFAVSTVTSNTEFVINQEFARYPDPDTNTTSIKKTIWIFKTIRVGNVDELNSVIPNRLKVNELAWVDDTGAGIWTVYQHNRIYSSIPFNNSDPGNLTAFGKTVATGSLTVANSTPLLISAVSNGQNELYIFIKADNINWIRNQKISLTGNEALVNAGKFADSLAFSPDLTWLAAGTPEATNVYGSTNASSREGMVSIYKVDANKNYVQHTLLAGPMPVGNKQFGYKVCFAGTDTLLVTATKADNSGAVYVYRLTNNVWNLVQTLFEASAANTGAYYGHSLSSTLTGDKIVVGAPGVSRAYAYKLVTNQYVPDNQFAGSQAGESLGSSVAISDTGTYIAISSSYYDIDNLPNSSNEGKVVIYNSNYTVKQIITSRNPEDQELFGTKIAFMDDYKTLLIYSQNADSVEDDYSATYVDSGRVDIYDMYNTTWIWSENTISPNPRTAGFGAGFAVGKDYFLVSAPYEDTVDYTDVGVVHNFQKISNTYSWTPYRVELPKVDLPKIKKVYLYNKKTNELVNYIDIVDPIQGNIMGIADQEIKYKTYYDPATYTVGVGGVNVDEGQAWTDRQVGRLWWNLTRAKFIDAYSGDIVFRSANWNTLYPSASIDIYEWVESTLKPSEWDKQADTVVGLTNNISGKSLYGDTVYSVKKRYDNVAKTFKNTYYFWVKNKTTVPNVVDRKLSAIDVARLIADPKGQGEQYIAFLGNNAFSLANVAPDLAGKDVHLGVEYWTVDDYTINTHAEWKIISDDTNSSLPARFETKLIDSLTGKDEFNRVVPDLKLPPKLRYGVEDRPRQSMFVNRYEALKEYLERVNAALIQYTIAEDRDISNLKSYETEPSTISGLYDTVIDTEKELRFIGTSTFVQAKLTAVIVDGKITDVRIVEAGQGYVNAPYIDVLSSRGRGAKIKSVLGTKGQVTGVIIESSGEGYDDRTTVINNVEVPYTTLSVRSLSALVHVDSEANGIWSIYSYDAVTKVWSRVRSQSYNVNRYWKYVDWYATGYTQFTLIDHFVDATYLLSDLTVKIGQLVKVKNSGTGGWAILEKYADVASVDYTQSYKVVARQNGTIQFLDSLYKFANTNLGYDGPLYDNDSFDNTASKELRIILNTIKDKILIDDLKQYYLDAFLACIRYAFREQTYIDWAFKTSFVRAQHNVGPLLEKVTYNNDNLADFEAYVNEVKPYRTKVREFVSSYTTIDNSQSVVTDFDLQSVYENGQLLPVTANVVNGRITSSSNVINTYPWRHWLDNAGFKITEIRIVDGGSGYLFPPKIDLVNDNPKGRSGKAKAYISNGVVNRIVIEDPGAFYLKAPTVVISGGLGLTGKDARAIAVIGDSVARSNYIRIKFDRISGQYYITKLQETETFPNASGSQTSFVLKYSPTTVVTDSSIKINGVDALYGTYTLSTKKSVTRGYTSYYGLLTFKTAPAKGSTITITYNKDFNYLSAADRINWYYNPSTKELGKSTGQLMAGVDYGGVQVVGLGFAVPTGWGSQPWFTEGWDSFDPTFDDYILPINAGNVGNSFDLPYTPAAGEQINIYYRANGTDKHIRIDSLEYAGTEDINNPAVVMQTFVGDGLTKTINIPITFTVSVGDEFIFRKSTSDGSIKLPETDFDTALTGGDLAYSSATGLAADDIIVDGDGFVTTTSSHGPEEIIPGQIVDTLAIKVTTRPVDGSAEIKYNNYIYDGSTMVYPLGLLPNNPQAVLVLYSNKKKPLVIDVDYTVDYQTKEVTLLTTPGAKAVISVITFGYSGSNLAEIDYFISSGTTNEYITNARWLQTGMNAIVYVNGETVPFELFETDSSYEKPGLTGIRFVEKITKNYIINYVIINGTDPSYSLMKSETVATDGVAKKFQLRNKIGKRESLTANMLVYSDADNSVYTASLEIYFTIENNQFEYTIPNDKFRPYSFTVDDLLVLADGSPLTLGIDYTIDLSVISIKIKSFVYSANENKELKIIVTKATTYTYDGTYIEFNSAPPAGNIHVISHYNHNYLDVRRTSTTLEANASLVQDSLDYYNYNSLFGGRIKLDRQVTDDSRVWIVKNGKLLQHSVDYRLEPDLTTVTLTEPLFEGETITALTYGSANITRKLFSFMQFKDMLNRTHYKRLSVARQTKLAEPLNYNDIQIVVEDDRVLNTPNPNKNLPGIIYVNGERIEYFIKEGKVLRQLRRGTLGTGVKSVYPAGTLVQDIGTSETIPYKDTTIVEQLESNGSSLVYPLKNIALTLDTSTTAPRNTWYRDTIPANYGQSNDVEVLVGGYQILGDWLANYSYKQGDVVVYGSYYFRCVTAHVSSTSFETDTANWKFFIGNTRLKKHPYKVHNVNINYESPEGDVQFEADFGVDGIDYGTTTVSAFNSKNGSGPYLVTLTIPTRLRAPATQSQYIISGNSNPNYNGAFVCTSSTLTSITLQYPSDPGDYGSGTTTVKFPSPEYRIRLTNVLSTGTKFNVIKKTLTRWEDPNSSLKDSTNPIAKFILADLDLVDNVTDIDGQPLTDNDGNILEL